jgi:hypothetical protein
MTHILGLTDELLRRIVMRCEGLRRRFRDQHLSRIQLPGWQAAARINLADEACDFSNFFRPLREFAKWQLEWELQALISRL